MTVDLIIRRAVVVDGLGSQSFLSSLAVNAGRIVSIGDEPRARRTLDADGRVLCPGFIDMHTHSDLALVERGVLDMKLAQGVTLEVVGQDGLSCAPVTDDAVELVAELIAALNGETSERWSWRTVSDYLNRLDGRCAQNVAHLVPHGTVRACVMGNEEREASPEELGRMRKLVVNGMREGAFGISTGLSYPPAHASTTEEVVELTRAVHRFRGLYVTHLRSYGEGLVEATGEALEIGKRSGLAVHFSHLQAPGRQNHGLGRTLLQTLEQARTDGLDVSFDVYPYEAASTMLTAFLPPPIRYVPRHQAITLLADPSFRSGLIEEIDSSGPVGMDVAWSDVQVANGLDMIGDADARLVELARRRGETVGATIATLLELTECRASVVVASTLESDVTSCLMHPLATVGSDGLLVGERPHPRGFGTFPRFLRRTRENGLSLELGISAMTGRPANVLGLRDRGHIGIGAAADLCLFSPEGFVDRATYDQPTVHADGMDLVLVNGVVVWEDGTATGATPGRALRYGGSTSVGS